MHILCFIGIHRWEFRDHRDGMRIGTFARCARPCCTRYPQWSLVNIDRVGG